MTNNPLTLMAQYGEAIVAQAGRAVVTVRARGAMTSSGFLWRAGCVVTAAEQVEREDDITVQLPDGRDVAANLAGNDLATDVALLRMATAGEVMLRPAARPPAAGAPVFVVGRAPEGVVAACGIIALVGAPWRSRRGGRIAARLELDLRLSPLAEGGVALDAEGGLLGMAVFGPQRSTLVIPLATIDATAAQLEAHGRARRGWLGMALQPVALPSGGSGLIVVGVAPDGPASRAGLMLGDVLVAWEGAPLTCMRDLLGCLDADSVGREVTLSLLRAGAPAPMCLTVAERPLA